MAAPADGGSVAELPEVPDLAVITTSPWATPEIVGELGKKGIHAVLIVMGGLSLPAPLVPGRLGGAVELQANTLAITRAEGQDTQRAFARARWDLRRITPMALLSSWASPAAAWPSSRR